jgi:hypothetical protein
VPTLPTLPLDRRTPRRVRDAAAFGRCRMPVGGAWSTVVPSRWRAQESMNARGWRTGPRPAEGSRGSWGRRAPEACRWPHGILGACCPTRAAGPGNHPAAERPHEQPRSRPDDRSA